MNALRFTATNKVVAGLALILLIGMLSMLFIYRGLDIVEQDVQKLANVEQPTSLAAYEMEINLNGSGCSPPSTGKARALAKIAMDMEALLAEMGLWTITYQEDSDRRHRRLIFAKERELRRAFAQFQRLDLSAETTEHVAVIGAMMHEMSASVRHILTLEDDLDEQAARFVDCDSRWTTYSTTRSRSLL